MSAHGSASEAGGTNHTDGTTLYAVRLAEGKKHSAADIHRRGLDEKCSGNLVRFDGFGMGVLKTRCQTRSNYYSRSTI